ncbi:MAG: MATE family efflux transporter [Clostridia bacterium]|nr:MATE family efflux transporter [Clostridia bacterium]
MTQGAIWKHLVFFSLPMMIGLCFQQLYNTVDIVVVGQFVGKEALAAVGSTSSIINTLVGFSAGLSMGSSVIISQCYGAHDYKKLRLAVHTTLALTFILSVIATVLGIVLVDPLLRMMDTPADVYDEAKTYLNIYLSGLVGLLLYNMGSGILRAVGDSRRPLYFLCFSAVLNTLFDLLFVIGFGMGVEGVAYATILAQAVSAVLVLVVLTRDRASYGIYWREVRLDIPTLKRILSIGLPSGLQQALTGFSNVFVQSYINYFGAACMAGWSTYSKLDSFLFVPAQSIAMASTTFVGQNFGAKQMSRAREGVKQAQIMSVAVTAVLSILMILFARNFTHLFTTDPAVVEYAVRFITLISPFYITTCFNQTYAGALRGIGNAKTPMFVLLFSFVAFRQMYLFTVRLLGNSLFWISLAYPAGWIMASLLLTVFYRRSPLCCTAEQAPAI